MACTLAAHAADTPHADAKRPPNILFILMDDMGWTDAACLGSDLYKTPNIDRLAKQGMLFTNAYACAPISAPSRAGLLTGKVPARLNLTDVYNHKKAARYTPLVEPKITPDVSLDEWMIPEVLKSRGYVSGQIGKWHVGGYLAEYWPKDQGFDEEFTINKNPTHEPEDYKWIYSYTDKAVDFMRRHKEQPFFLYLAHLAPHHPYEASAELTASYAGLIRPGMRHSMPIYAATIEMIDENLGRLMKELDALGLADNTIVVFTSDNGGRVANVDYRPPTSNAPLRLGKHTLYEGGIRVPLIVRWPGKIPADTTTSFQTTNLDFLPTFAQIAGVPSADLPKDIDGESILPVLLNPKAKMPERSLFWYYPHYNLGETFGANTMPPNCRPSAAIRVGNYKLLEWLEDPKAVELYDLAQDPGEQTNMAPFMPDKVAELRARMKDWEQKSHVAQLTPMPGYKKALYGQIVPKVPGTAAKADKKSAKGD